MGVMQRGRDDLWNKKKGKGTTTTCVGRHGLSLEVTVPRYFLDFCDDLFVVFLDCVCFRSYV